MKNAFRIALGFALALSSFEAHATTPTSTINPNVPAQNSALSSSVLRANFQAAVNDIDNLWIAIGSQVSGITTLTGDVTASGSGSVPAVVARVNGVSYPLSPSVNTIPEVTSIGAVTYQPVSGTGSIALTNTPTFVTPVLGAATGTSVSLSGVVTGLSFTATGSGANVIPSGTTGQRPTAAEGQIRDNTTLHFVEAYLNGAWQSLTTTAASLDGLIGASGANTGIIQRAANGTYGLGTFATSTNCGLASLVNGLNLNLTTQLPVTKVTSAGTYNISANDCGSLVSVQVFSNNVIGLADPVSLWPGYWLSVQNIQGGTWTITPANSKTVNAKSSIPLGKYNGGILFTDGANWFYTGTESDTVTPIAQGGTGQITQQLGLNALAGAVTSAQYLRGNGTNVTMSAIQAADVPTLNQNTTGNAATVTTNANLTGDVTSVGNATTLRTVNSNVGTFGAANSIPVFTLNAKGLLTSASSIPIFSYIDLKALGLPTGGDDTTAINNAFTAAAAAGVPVYAPAATYNHGNVINQSAPLFGDGDGSTFNCTDASGTSPNCAFNMTGSGTFMRNVRLTSVYTTGRYGGSNSAGIFNKATHCAIEHVTVDHFPQPADWNELTSDCVYADFKISSIGSNGIYNPNGNHDIAFINNVCDTTGDTCIETSSTTTAGAQYRISYMQNISRNSATHCFSFVGADTGTGIGNQCFNPAAVGLYTGADANFQPNTNIIWDGNITDTTSGQGAIDVGGRSGQVAQHIKIVNNIIKNATGPGIRIGNNNGGTYIDYVDVGNNDITGNSGVVGNDCIDLWGVLDAQVEDNHCLNWSGNGIGFSTTNAGTVIGHHNIFTNIDTAVGTFYKTINAVNSGFTKIVFDDNVENDGANGHNGALIALGTTDPVAYIFNNVGDTTAYTSPNGMQSVSPGGIVIGTSYAGVNAPPSNGAIIQGIVGIGTSSPQSALDVRGAAIFADRSFGITFATAGAARSTITSDTANDITLNTSASTAQVFVANAGVNQVAIGSTGVEVGTSYLATAAPTNGMIIQGQVGMGSTAVPAGVGLYVSGGHFLLDNNKFVEAKNSSGSVENIMGIDTSNNTNINSGGGSVRIVNAAQTATLAEFPNAGGLAVGSTTVPTGVSIQAIGNIASTGVYLATEATTAIASATTIAPVNGLQHVSGTATIATITPPSGMTSTAGGVGGSITLIADAAWLITNTGNIQASFTASINTPYTFWYSPSSSKWYLK